MAGKSILYDVTHSKALKKKNELERKYANLSKEFNRVNRELDIANQKLNRVESALKERGILIRLDSLLNDGK